MLIFFKGKTNKVYRKCDISHMRYIALAIFKNRKRNKTGPASSFSRYPDCEITHQRKNSEAKKRKGDLGIHFSRSRPSLRCRRGGLVDNGRYLYATSLSPFHLTFKSFKWKPYSIVEFMSLSLGDLLGDSLFSNQMNISKWMIKKQSPLFNSIHNFFVYIELC